jgi:hypothetical protein
MPRWRRGRRRLEAARDEVRTGAISGAVGTFANIDPAVEAHVCAQLGLEPEPISTQVIPRDRHAMFFATLGVIASSIENIATEIRHMQRTEVLEGEEFFSAGQKGSSAMPHKRNPVLTENLTGLARLVRGMVVPALENVALWHERDISHSSVERMIGPDATVTLDFALHRLAGVIEKLVIYPDNMLANMNKFRGLVMSQRVLLALTQAGVTREDAYRLVQRNAMKVWEEGKDFKTELLADAEVRARCRPRRSKRSSTSATTPTCGHDLRPRLRHGLSPTCPATDPSTAPAGRSPPRPRSAPARPPPSCRAARPTARPSPPRSACNGRSRILPRTLAPAPISTPSPIFGWRSSCSLPVPPSVTECSIETLSPTTAVSPMTMEWAWSIMMPLPIRAAG